MYQIVLLRLRKEHYLEANRVLERITKRLKRHAKRNNDRYALYGYLSKSKLPYFYFIVIGSRNIINDIEDNRCRRFVYIVANKKTVLNKINDIHRHQENNRYIVQGNISNGRRLKRKEVLDYILEK